MENKKSDIYLWTQIKKGDPHAYHKLYDLNVDTLFSFGMQYTNDHQMVQDAIHDVFVELYLYRKTVAEQVVIKSYLFKALQRNIYRKLKSQIKIVSLDKAAENLYHSDSIEDEFIFSENTLAKHTNLALALNSLTKKQRYALHLRFNEDLSYEEISCTLQISLESCRTLIYRSLTEIRKKL